MPVRFVISRDLPPGVDRVTLSYSFFESMLTEQPAAQTAFTG
jgi:cytochrome c oxidase assembly protein Cox11